MTRIEQKIVTFMAAIIAGKARWERLSDEMGEVCVNGIRHCTDVDFRGLPLITDHTELELHKVLAASPEEKK